MKDTKRIENLHLILWLMKDCAWCSSWRYLGMAMALPTLAVAGKIAWASRKDSTDLVHNIVVCLWMCANITWMTGEFFFEDSTRPFAKLFFYAGAAVLAAFYACEITKQCKFI